MVRQSVSQPGRRTGVKWRGTRYTPRRKVCSFCADKLEIGYKDSAKLRRYISDRARILPRRRTGTCAKHQRALAVTIKRARHIALLPFAPEHIYRQGNVASLSPSPMAIEPVSAESAPSLVAEEKQ